MSNFVAQVRVKLLDEELKTLQNLKDQTVNVKVNLTGDGANFIKEFNSQMSSMSSTALQSGRRVATMFNKGIKSIDRDSFYKEHFDEQKKMVAESQKLSKQYNVSEKNAMKAVEARKKAESNYAKEVEKRARLEQQTEDRWKKNLHDKEQARLKEEKQTEERWLRNLHTQEQAQKKAKQAQEAARQKLERDTNDRWLKNLHEQEQAQKSLINNYSKGFSTGKYSADSKIYKSQIDKYADQETYALTRARSALEEYNNIRNELQNNHNGTAFVGIDDGVLIQKFDAMEIAATKYKNAMREVSSESTRTLKDGEAIVKSNEILTYYNNNTKAIKKYGQSLKDLSEDAKKAKTVADMDDINRRFKELKTTISAEGLTGKSFLDDFKRAAGQIAQFTGIYGVLQNVMQDIPREMAQQVIKVDDAMTNLRMATSITNKEAQSLMKTYSELGNELKATGVDVATSATEWLKQGKSIQEAQNLAADSIVLSKIGGISSEDATKTITAAMKSYDLAESEVMGFIDKISSIDLVSATDVGGLSQAFNEVAANAKNAGVESEKLLAYAAVIGETSQEGMASVGTSLNAVFSRMGNIKLSRLKDYETGEDLSNVETVLRGVGISLRDTQGQFREFDDVLDETANRWTSYSSVQKRAVAQAFAGTHHMNEFMILMQNWGKVQEYTKTATEASGQSMEKFSAYQESATGKIEGFKNAFQSLSTATLDSNLFKGAIDSGTGLLTLLTEIIDAFGLIPTVASVIGGASFIKNFDKPRKHRVSPKIFSYI